MPKYPFLSDDWVAEAQRIYAEVDAAAVLAGTTFAPVRVNLIITEAPFSERPIDAHVETGAGGVEISMGHIAQPDVTVSMGYPTARALFVAGDVQTVMQAFLGGRIRVDGDLSKLLDPRSGIWPSTGPAGPGAPGPGPGGGTAGGGEGAPAPPGLGLAGPTALALAVRLKEITE